LADVVLLAFNLRTNNMTISSTPFGSESEVWGFVLHAERTGWPALHAQALRINPAAG
jgi:hypothetical protein